MKKRLRILLIPLLALAFQSCSVSYYYLKPSTHLPYPNANVVSNGKQLTAKKSKFGFFIPPVLKGDDEREVINAALMQDSDADLLLDAGFTWKVLNILGYFNFASLTVEGESARQVIGKQDLNN